MISNKPDLLQMDRPIWRILPHLRSICVASFVQSQSLKPGSDTGADLMIVKLVFSLKQPPEPRQAQPKRLDRIPYPNRRDGNAQVAIVFRKGPQTCSAVPIMAIGQGHVTLGGLITPEQPDAIDQSRQRACRKGSARVANQKNLIARLIAARQSAVDLLNLQIQPAAGKHRPGGYQKIAPIKLQPRLIMQCHTRPSVAFQKLIGQPGICFEPLLQRGKRAVHHNNMHHSARRDRKSITHIFHNLAKSVLPNFGLDPMQHGHDDLACVLQHAPNPLRREGHIGPSDTL